MMAVVCFGEANSMDKYSDLSYTGFQKSELYKCMEGKIGTKTTDLRY